MRPMIYISHQHKGRTGEKRAGWWGNTENKWNWPLIAFGSLLFWASWVQAQKCPSQPAESPDAVGESLLGGYAHNAGLLVYPRSGVEGWDRWVASRVDPGGGGGGVKSEIQTTCETGRRGGLSTILHTTLNERRRFAPNIFFESYLGGEWCGEASED